MSAKKIVELDYEVGDLPEILEGLYRRQIDGTATIEVSTVTRSFQRVLVLRGGRIVYAGPTVPTPYEFVIELSRYYAHIEPLDTILKFAATRTSIRNVVETMVNAGVLQWNEVAAAVQRSTVAVLEEVYPTAGRIVVESGPVAFDLDYLDPDHPQESPGSRAVPKQACPRIRIARADIKAD